MTTVKDGERTAERVLHWNKLDEVSMVTAGDNPEAHVLLLKQQQEEAARGKPSLMARLKAWAGIKPVEKYGQPRTIDQVLLWDTFNEEMWKLRYAFSESVSSIMECADPMQMADMMAATGEQFAKRLKELVSRMSGGDAQKAKALVVLVEQMEANAHSLKEAKGAVEKRAPLVESLAALETFAFASSDLPLPTTNEEPMPADKNAPATTTPDTGMEAMKADLAKLLETQKAQQAELDAAKARAILAEKAAADAMIEAKKYRDDGVDAEFRGKAKMLNLGDHAKVTLALKVAAGVVPATDESRKALEEVLSGAAALVRKAEQLVGKKLGVSHGDDPEAQHEPESAVGKVHAMAHALMDKDPELDFEHAKLRIYKAHPDLKKAAIAEGVGRKG